MTTITGKASVWISQYSPITPEEIQSGAANVAGFTFFGIDDDMSSHGYTRVGVANITIDAEDGKTIIANKVDALRAEATAIRAEATAKVTRIESQIQNLLAISYDSPKDD